MKARTSAQVTPPEVPFEPAEVRFERALREAGERFRRRILESHLPAEVKRIHLERLARELGDLR